MVNFFKVVQKFMVEIYENVKCKSVQIFMISKKKSSINI
jgi:hypothetical protein